MDRSSGSLRPETAEFGHRGQFLDLQLATIEENRVAKYADLIEWVAVLSLDSRLCRERRAYLAWDLCGRLERSELLSHGAGLDLLQPTTVPEKHENIWPCAISMIRQSAQAQLLHWRALDSHIAQRLYVNQ
jgi:hypothetical protein